MKSKLSSTAASVLFITGTDTGAGKTVLTCLIMAHLRRRGIHAQAIKPFLSGNWDDARLLAQMQDGELTLREISPFFFPAPVAPLVAARKRRQKIALDTVIEKITEAKSRCEVLLVEGIGGLRVPLGEDYTVADLIVTLRPGVVVAAPNRLGVINHAILAGRDLYSIGVKRYTIALMGQGRCNLATRTNGKILREWLAPNPVFEVPWLGKNAQMAKGLRSGEKKIEKVIARITGSGRLCIVAAR
jgi:dethiobiotin synthetase